MSDMSEYLAKKAAELDLGRGGQLNEIQAYFDTLYPGQCRAITINNNTLKVGVNSSSLASELRMRQVEVLRKLKEFDVQKMQIALTS